MKEPTGLPEYSILMAVIVAGCCALFYLAR